MKWPLGSYQTISEQLGKLVSEDAGFLTLSLIATMHLPTKVLHVSEQYTKARTPCIRTVYKSTHKKKHNPSFSIDKGHTGTCTLKLSVFPDLLCR